MASTWTKRGLVAGVMVGVTMGCASTGGRMASDGEPSGGFRSDVITSAELDRVVTGLTLMEEIEHARPWFLHSRGSTSLVSVDGLQPTEASVLRTIPLSQVKEVRLVHSGPPAVLRDGTLAVGDVILVATRRH